MRKIILIIITSALFFIVKGQELNTVGNFNGVIISTSYAMTPIASLSPTEKPLAVFGVGIGFITNDVVQLGIYANKSLPSTNYMTGYTLTADTISIAYSTRDLRIGLSYLIYFGNRELMVSPYVEAGIGDMQIDRVELYADERKTLLEEASLIQAEFGIRGNYIIQNSFMISLGISYLFSMPDRLLINLSSKEMNMMKVSVGISLGIISSGNNKSKNKRRNKRR